MSKKTKLHYTIFFSVIIIFILLVLLASWNFGKDEEIIWGATFSKKQCEELGLDWKIVFEKTINELPIQVIRLPIYWDDVEQSPGKLAFDDYVWMVNKAAEKNIEIVPVLGRRVPRWPECHTPKFYLNLSEEKIKPKIFNLIQAEIHFFQNYPNIKKWQLDNEPFADFFGNCPPADKNLVEQEIALVKSLDNRPILITEAGELSTWIKGGKLADILGISMYRQTWTPKTGWFRYPFAPSFYYFKAQLVEALTGVESTINTELQVEPWATGDSLKNMDLFEQYYAMDLPQIKQNVNFAKRAGLNEIYLWGVEWWWYMGEQHGNWEFWEYGKQLK